MTKQQFEEQINELLKAAAPPKRKQVESDVVFQLCRKEGDMKNAYAQACDIIFGKAENVRQMRRMVKKRRRNEMAGPLLPGLSE